MTPVPAPLAGWLSVPPIAGAVACWRYRTEAGWLDLRFWARGIEAVSGPGGAGRVFTEDPQAVAELARGFAAAHRWVGEQEPVVDVDQLDLFEEATHG